MADRRTDVANKILLNEYSNCQSSVESLDASVWQSASIIGLVTIGTFALTVANSPSVWAAIIVALFSTLGVFVWWRMAVRWWSVRDIKIERMRHIEQDLGIPGQTHYIEYMDRLHDDPSPRSAPEYDSRVRTLARRYGIHVDRARELARVPFQRKGPRDALESFRWVALIVWTLYIALRAIGPIWQYIGFKLLVLPFWSW